MYGRFKFVLDKKNQLHIGFANTDYHRDICGNLPDRQVQAAGYLLYDGHWVVNGSSVGYGISYTRNDLETIQNLLDGFDEEYILSLMAGEKRLLINR